MKIHVLSDLHIEFAAFDAPRTDADVVILAGDIAVGATGVEWAGDTFPDRPVIYVPGNHEYYGHDIGLTEKLRAAAPDNVRVLNDEAVEIGGARILGCTLWTDFDYYGEPEAARRYSEQALGDFAAISNGERRFTPEDAAALHEQSRHWLINELAAAFDGPTIVVTHHLPAAPSVAPRYAEDPLNPAFASRLESLIETHRPALWVHGHTHAPCDYELFGTRVVCNPRGYPGEVEASGFRADLVLELPH